MGEPVSGEAAEAARFYDALRTGGASLAALAHGEARIQRLQMSRHLAATGVLGQLGCIAAKPGS